MHVEMILCIWTFSETSRIQLEINTQMKEMSKAFGQPGYSWTWWQKEGTGRWEGEWVKSSVKHVLLKMGVLMPLHLPCHRKAVVPCWDFSSTYWFWLLDYGLGASQSHNFFAYYLHLPYNALTNQIPALNPVRLLGFACFCNVSY